MFLIFDTYGGLCNQMYDIQASINFCELYNIQFSFRYSSLREKNDLTKWYNVHFNELFSDDFIESKLYTPFCELKCNIDNTYNFNNNIRCIEWLYKDSAILPQLYKIDKEFIILRQFWSLCIDVPKIVNIFSIVKPSNKILYIYRDIQDTLPEKYNYLHYRYEDDFIAHFRIKDHPRLCDLINSNMYGNNELKLYIAAYMIEHIPIKFLTKPITEFENVIYKKDNFNQVLNFEELAFIDFLIGRNAEQIYGHSNSSFSLLLNSAHNSNNYYN